MAELKRDLIADSVTIAQLKRDVVADAATFAALRRDSITDSATVAQLRPLADAASVPQRCRVARRRTGIGGDIIGWFFGY